MDAPSPAIVRRVLLRWFDGAKRDLPWRRTRDPYHILLAEYLLQRTRVASGTPYYERFLARFPDVASLAAASEEDVLRAWEGLGYYRRARNLRAAAKAIVERHGGRIPSTAASLQELPGIGPYTAGAVASIAFGERVPAVDGNVTRVLARLFRIEDDVATRPGRDRVNDLAVSLVPSARPGAFNQALMELGATICTPKSPRCRACPLAERCLARHAGVQANLPRTPAKRESPLVPVAFALVTSGERVLLVHRPRDGLLGGLWSLPGGEVPPKGDVKRRLERMVTSQTGVRVRTGRTAARITHTFSHRRWSGAVYRCRPMGGADLLESARWASPGEVRELPLVPFHRKVLHESESRATLERFDASGG